MPTVRIGKLFILGHFRGARIGGQDSLQLCDSGKLHHTFVVATPIYDYNNFFLYRFIRTIRCPKTFATNAILMLRVFRPKLENSKRSKGNG